MRHETLRAFQGEQFAWDAVQQTREAAVSPIPRSSYEKIPAIPGQGTSRNSAGCRTDKVLVQKPSLSGCADRFKWGKVEFVMTTNMNTGSPSNDTLWIPGRVRTAKEARDLLEQLRSSYRSLAQEQREEIKNYMAHLSEHQRRFGSTAPIIEGSFSEGSVKG